MAFLSAAFAYLHTPVGSAILLAMLSISEAIGMSDKFKESAIMSYLIKALRFVKDKVLPSK